MAPRNAHRSRKGKGNGNGHERRRVVIRVAFPEIPHTAMGKLLETLIKRENAASKALTAFSIKMWRDAFKEEARALRREKNKRIRGAWEDMLGARYNAELTERQCAYFKCAFDTFSMWKRVAIEQKNFDALPHYNEKIGKFRKKLEHAQGRLAVFQGKLEKANETLNRLRGLQ